jgi:hypothetical protein
MWISVIAAGLVLMMLMPGFFGAGIYRKQSRDKEKRYIFQY